MDNRAMGLLLFKFVFSFLVIYTLNYIAENSSPRAAGIIGGLPTGSAITIFILWLDQGDSFANQAISEHLPGVIAMGAFALGYSLYCYNNKIRDSIKSTFAAILCFAICTLALGPLKSLNDPYLTFIIVIVGLIVLSRIFPQSKGKVAVKKHQMSTNIIKCISGSILIVAVTFIGGLAGPKAAGILSALPLTFFPLLVIMHLGSGENAVASISRGFPIGLISLATFSFSLNIIGAQIGFGPAMITSILISLIPVFLVESLRKIHFQNAISKIFDLFLLQR